MKIIKFFVKSSIYFIGCVLLLFSAFLYVPFMQPISRGIINLCLPSDMKLTGVKGTLGNHVQIESLSINENIKVKQIEIDWSFIQFIETLSFKHALIKVDTIEYAGKSNASSSKSSKQDEPFKLKALYKGLDSVKKLKLPEIMIKTIFIEKKKLPLVVNCSYESNQYVCSQQSKAVNYSLQITPQIIKFDYKVDLPELFSGSGKFYYQKRMIQINGNLNSIKLPNVNELISVDVNINTDDSLVRAVLHIKVNNEIISITANSEGNVLKIESKIPASIASIYPSIAAYEPNGTLACAAELDLTQGNLRFADCSNSEIQGVQQHLGKFSLNLKHLFFKADKIDVKDMTLQQESDSPIHIDATADVKKLSGTAAIVINALKLYFFNDYQIKLDGKMDLTFNAKAGSISGSILLTDFNKKSQHFFSANIPTIDVENVETGSHIKKTPYPVDIDLHITSKNLINIKDKGVSIYVQPNLHIQGSNTNLNISGNVKIEKGVVELLQHQFTVLNSDILLSNNQTNMRLFMEAPYEQYLFKINVTGTTEKPNIKLFSTPSLPPNEILSRLLFSSSFDDLSPIQVVQLLKVLDSFKQGNTDNKIPDVTNSLKDLLKLDGLVLGHLPGKGYGIGLVKQLNQKATVGVSQSLDENGLEANIKVKISKRLELQGKSGNAQNPSSIELKWKKDF